MLSRCYKVYTIKHSHYDNTNEKLILVRIIIAREMNVKYLYRYTFSVMIFIPNQRVIVPVIESLSAKNRIVDKH